MSCPQWTCRLHYVMRQRRSAGAVDCEPELDEPVVEENNPAGATMSVVPQGGPVELGFLGAPCGSKQGAGWPWVEARLARTLPHPAANHPRAHRMWSLPVFPMPQSMKPHGWVLDPSSPAVAEAEREVENYF
eukprot:2994031-Prymnesium_polylepis.2